MKWEEAIKKFSIGKIYHDASLSGVEAMYPTAAQIGEDWVRNPKFLYISGNPGSGKTYFCMALLRGLLEMRTPEWVVFKRSDELDDTLLKAIEMRDERTYIEAYQEVPYLFIDDLGIERVNDRIIKQYYSIINKRVENLLPTVITSNVPLELIGNNLGERIASRLSVMTEVKFPKKDLRKTLIV